MVSRIIDEGLIDIAMSIQSNLRDWALFFGMIDRSLVLHQLLRSTPALLQYFVKLKVRELPLGHGKVLESSAKDLSKDCRW